MAASEVTGCVVLANGLDLVDREGDGEVVVIFCREKHIAKLSSVDDGADIKVWADCSCGWKSHEFSVLHTALPWSVAWDEAKAHGGRPK